MPQVQVLVGTGMGMAKNTYGLPMHFTILHLCVLPPPSLLTVTSISTYHCLHLRLSPPPSPHIADEVPKALTNKINLTVRTCSNRFIAISYNLNQGLNTSFSPNLGLNFGLNLGPVWRSSGSNFGPELDCSTTSLGKMLHLKCWAQVSIILSCRPGDSSVGVSCSIHS
jgi:hypothetical protein